MALSGSVSTNGCPGDGEGRYYTLSWSATQSIANNTSTISWTLSTSGGYSSWMVERTLWVKIDNDTVYSKTNAVNRYTGTIASGTKTITHNSDGSRSFKVELAGAIYYTDTKCTGSQTFSLNTIARASGLSVSNGTLGSSQTITADRKSSSFTHTLTWECGAYSGIIASKSSATSWSFTPELKLATGAPYGTQVYCSFKLTTYNGSTTVGSASKAVWLTIPTSVTPTCSLTLTEAKGHLATYGGYIQGQSILHVVVNASGAYGSVISAYTTSANGSAYTSQTFDTNALMTVGTNTVTTTIKDSRGRTASASSSITVLAYNRPRITELSVHRCDQDGTENDRGAYARITYAYSITSLSSKNANTCVLKYKQSGENDWTTMAITPSSYDMSGTEIIAADDAHSYDVSITVTDAFASTTSATSVSTGFCLYHIPASGKGITFGGIAESDGFNIKMDAAFSENIDIKKSIYMNGADAMHKDTNGVLQVVPSTHFAGGLTEDIPVHASGDCNSLTTSGTYYIGTSGTNKPGSGLNGWLTVKTFGINDEYCCQDYVTYQGARYRRMRDNGTWGSWISEANLVIEEGTSGNWTYMKWSSGFADLVYRGNVTPSSTAAVGNGIYTNIITIAMPFGVTGNVTVTGTVQNLYFISNPDWSYANKSVSFRLQRQTSITLGAVSVMLRVSGNWRT